jgi:hypothetical protein
MTALPRTRQRAFQAIALTLSVVFSLALAEVALRVYPVIPPPEQLDIEIDPGGKYQEPDAELGFRPLPGTYRFVFDHKYPWTLTNLPDTTRITRPVSAYTDSSPQPALWIFGCSFTQGWGLDDNGTMPWKVQERLPFYDVVNFGVGGYGTLQSLIQFRRALTERPSPQVVVLVYADFHDQRNVRTDAWRDANFNFERFGTTSQPYARLDWSGNLVYGWGDGVVPLMGWRRRSAALNVAAIGYGRVKALFLREHRVSELLIEQFANESRQRGIQFVLAGVWPNDGTRDMLRAFAERGITTVDVSTDQKNPQNLIPYDGHPSAFANEHSANTLVRALRP